MPSGRGAKTNVFTDVVIHSGKNIYWETEMCQVLYILVNKAEMVPIFWHLKILPIQVGLNAILVRF